MKTTIYSWCYNLKFYMNIYAFVFPYVLFTRCNSTMMSHTWTTFYKYQHSNQKKKKKKECVILLVFLIYENTFILII